MSPALRLSAIRLVVETEAGTLGRELRLADGLNVLRADNTSGKSTALQSVIYGLGLEGMLSPSHRIPLPHAMTDSVSIGGRESEVVDSRVEIEIRNGGGESIVAARAVRSLSKDINLVSVTLGAAITVPGDYEQRDYFVRRAGAAQNEAGFHRYLAEFLGLDLPRVSKMDGSEVPLYLETLFPYFFVEQKHGWSGIQARIPTYLGIRDVGRRSAEFVLGLDVFGRILQRQRLSSTLAELEADWQATARQLDELARVGQFVVQGLPPKVGRRADPAKATAVAMVNGEWMALGQAAGALSAQIDESSKEVPTVGDSAPELEEQLSQLDAGLREVVAIAAALSEERQEVQGRLDQVEVRIDALNEDLQRHKDSQTLERFGSEHAHAMLADHVCPTCHQELNDGADISAHAMTTAENIDFIQRQIKVFDATKGDLTRVARALDVRRAALVEQARDYRTQIRAVRESLTTQDSAPSVADISRRIVLQQRLGELRTMEGEFNSVIGRLAEIAAGWSAQREALDGISGDELSGQDEQRLADVEASVSGQLKRYGFTSVEPTEIQIGRTSYRPVHDGFDLGFDLSASDMIRVIWAYLFALLDVGSRDSGNHLGFLVFDEPRQQETARQSYQALLAHAAQQGRSGVQVLIATSETSEGLKGMIDAEKINLIDLATGEKLLQPIATSQ